jgi:hypothetical protein
MKATKTFDRVRMKNDIQAHLLKQWRGLPQKEIRLHVSQHLATSDSDVAAWWRSIESGKVKHPR